MTTKRDYKTEKWRKYYREYSKKNRERRREIVRKSEARPEYKLKKKEYMKEWLKNNREKAREIARRYRHKNKARAIFKNAVARGDIIRKPCEVCENPKTDGHHPDYSKPLEVRWLCRKHHRESHRKS